jgi:hypothetical protein
MPCTIPRAGGIRADRKRPRPPDGLATRDGDRYPNRERVPAGNRGVPEYEDYATTKHKPVASPAVHEPSFDRLLAFGIWTTIEISVLELLRTKLVVQIPVFVVDLSFVRPIGFVE